MNISEELIRQIVTKVLQEAGGLCQPAFEKHVDPSGIISIQTATVRCEPFEHRMACLSRTWSRWRKRPAWAAASWSSTTPALSGH